MPRITPVALMTKHLPLDYCTSGQAKDMLYKCSSTPISTHLCRLLCPHYLQSLLLAFTACFQRLGSIMCSFAVHRIHHIRIGRLTLGKTISLWEFDPPLCAPAATLPCSEPTRALRERCELCAAGKGSREGFFSLWKELANRT